MKQSSNDRDLLILLASFVVSRVILFFVGIDMDYNAINVYWQYLSVDSLQNNLLHSVWYNHTQPPVFNLFLGSILKIFGSYSAVVFPIIFRLITGINVWLLYKNLQVLTPHSRIPLLLSLLYLLSPATMILESELFYTTFITMSLLISSYSLLKFTQRQTYFSAWGILLPLAIACLTRSMYNLSWLMVIAVVIIIYFRKTALKKLSLVAACCILLASSWYIKNYVVFGKFTTSTWLGMNLARNVFHDHPVNDSTKIESVEPFSKISAYSNFITGSLARQYAGINDAELLSEYKNGQYINEHHINYIEVSEKYADASKRFVTDNPGAYLKNVLQSAIIFFAPATRYPFAEIEASKIKYYDLVYSFNMTHLAVSKGERRWAMLISAIPKLIIYATIFTLVLLAVKRKRTISAINLFIVLTFTYIFTVSSLFEHYENMRFRFEIEPLFLLLLGQVVAHWRSAAHSRKPDVTP